MLEIIKNAHCAGLLEARVIEFGRWVRSGSDCTVGNGCHPIYAMMKKVEGGSGPAPLMADDEAELIGDAVNSLRRARPDLAVAIEYYYIVRASSNLQTLCNDLGCSRAQAGIIVKEAMHWLQGYFCGLLRRAA